MSIAWKMILVTILVGVPAFFLGPQLLPPGHDVPQPPAHLLPAYMAIAAVEALAFGFAVAFAAFGWESIRELRLGVPWLNGALFVSILWLVGNWWLHDSLHIHVGLDMGRLVFIELAFHMTLLACGLVLAFGFLRLARARPPVEKLA